MPIFAILTIIALTVYIFYKVKFFRSKHKVEKQLLSAKSSIALGLFVFFFGVNQLILWDTIASTIVGSIFIILGILSSFAGIKAYRYYMQFMMEDLQERKTNS